MCPQSTRTFSCSIYSVPEISVTLGLRKEGLYPEGCRCFAETRFLRREFHTATFSKILGSVTEAVAVKYWPLL